MKQRELTGLLCLIWVVTLLYGEMFAYWVPFLWSCSWPHHLQSSSTSSMDDVGYQNDYVKVAVIADPQLMDKTSLPLDPKSLAAEIAQFYTDLYMRRAYLGSILPLKPDAVIFLGDYFDGGPYLSNEEWQECLRRFKHIFDLKSHGRHTDFPVYYISGNHDIGYSGLYSYKPEVINRYENEFGMRNYKFKVGKVDFVAVDAQTLDGNPRQNHTSITWDFIKNVSSDLNSDPRILLTHIPLYRSDLTDCGPHRKSPIINQRIKRAEQDQEIWYQNYITKESSSNLLDSIKPVLVLSGHDHDQCAVRHEHKFGSIEELTVGTVSWQQGNLFPSFMLMSVGNFTVSNSSTQEAVLTQLCFLPEQTYIYISYIVLFIVTLLALLFWPTSSKSIWHQFAAFIGHFRQLLSSSFSGEGRKEKTDDEDAEFEMIWDAEGSMHLVRKSLTAPPRRSSDTASVERGTAVVRPIARKHNQNTEGSANLDINVEVGADLSGKTAAKVSKSWGEIIIHRFVRVVRMIVVIAAVNVPLYMMLLFKDWNDQLSES